MNTAELHVVLGGTGAAGSALVRELARQGKLVRAVSRSQKGDLPTGAEWKRADVMNAEALREAVRGASVVYLAAQPAYHRWPQEFPALIENVLTALPSPETKLVMVDNLYMYGPVTGSIHEGLPHAATDRKGRVRAEMTERLLSAHRSGLARVAIGRASDFYGPGVEASVADLNFFRKIASGRTVQWPARLNQPHSLSFVEDYARGLAILGERDEALGRAWHVPAAEPLTGRQFIELVAGEAGVTARPGMVPKALIRMVGFFNPSAREFGEMFYQFENAHVLDGSNFTRTFNFAPSAHREAVRVTLAWLRNHDARTAVLTG
ncbi:epimerase (plasmid) [Deinococcus aetherius]|uniref:Epimerase n=1 Tax=Deinococcus aetherius TaxID=200252 RepID=A0ABN6RK04_9DEIO|nr:NAD-dependent epimerase/dehydratase family protein [Deinococcus aetherius]BDP43667.1 epimerase [Deinococcus aetherius]